MTSHRRRYNVILSLNARWETPFERASSHKEANRMLQNLFPLVKMAENHRRAPLYLLTDFAMLNKV